MLVIQQTLSELPISALEELTVVGSSVLTEWHPRQRPCHSTDVLGALRSWGRAGMSAVSKGLEGGSV